MNLLGIHLTLLIGPTVPVPAPLILMEALQSVEVTHSDQRRSGFQITFQMGRSGPQDLLDYPLLSIPLLKPCNRVILIVTFNAIPRVLMDGIITNHQLSPSEDSGASTLTITGDDISVKMDMEQRPAEHPAQDEELIAKMIILSYAQYGLIPLVIQPPTVDLPVPTKRVPVQQQTDLEYLSNIAGRFGYVFYIIPGPVPLTNTAYWGPPERMGVPQQALSVNMGPQTNVKSINFQNNALSPTLFSGNVQDSDTNQSMPVQTFTSTRPPLSSQPALLTQSCVRQRHYRAEAGLNTMQSFARVQGMTDASTDVITVNGELDALRYGDLLQARGLVGLRGAGYNYDGTYYVKSVTHTIKKGEYSQRFSLTREGVGAISPVV
jgi:hypothetical protein